VQKGGTAVPQMAHQMDDPSTVIGYIGRLLRRQAELSGCSCLGPQASDRAEGDVTAASAGSAREDVFDTRRRTG
jgi:hypothetical protein